MARRGIALGSSGFRAFGPAWLREAVFGRLGADRAHPVRPMGAEPMAVLATSQSSRSPGVIRPAASIASHMRSSAGRSSSMTTTSRCSLSERSGPLQRRAPVPGCDTLIDGPASEFACFHARQPHLTVAKPENHVVVVQRDSYGAILSQSEPRRPIVASRSRPIRPSPPAKVSPTRRGALRVLVGPAGASR